MSPQALNTSQVIIIGAGPAGLTTALQLCRYGIQPLLFERQQAGGLLNNANWVENYPGFPGGITGPDLVLRIVEQAMDIGVRITSEAIQNLDYQNGLFIARTESSVYYAQQVVIATGTKPRRLENLLSPLDLDSKILYEIYPISLNVIEKHFTIIGAGDAAFDYAINLSKQNQVVILNRSDQVTCLPLLWERSRKNPQLEYRSNTQVIEVKPGSQGKLALTCTDITSTFTQITDYLVIAIGREPCLDILSPNLREQFQLLQCSGKLFLIGDVKNGLFRQTSIAVGDAMLVAMKIYQQERENAL
jgi:thioredoxin reductase